MNTPSKPGESPRSNTSDIVYFTARDLTERWGICRTTLYRMRIRGQIPQPNDTPFGPRWRRHEIMKLERLWSCSLEWEE